MSGPPDPSKSNAFEDRIRNLVLQTLSDPLSYPDQFSSWVTNQITLQMPAVDSTSGFDTSTPHL